jgi:C-terminal AAA-associated domain
MSSTTSARPASQPPGEQAGPAPSAGQEQGSTLGLTSATGLVIGSIIDGTLSEDFFLDMLRSGFSEDRAHQQLNLAIDWGRYAELYQFDADTGQLKLSHLPTADAQGRTLAPEAAH